MTDNSSSLQLIVKLNIFCPGMNFHAMYPPQLIGPWSTRVLLFIILNIAQSFYKRSFRKVQRVTEQFRKMDDLYKHACEMFDENSRIKEPSDLFGTFRDFINMFQVK